MIDPKVQPKIPVKKADGTTVFLTMEEFRTYKASGVLPNPSLGETSPVITPVNSVNIDSPAPKKLEPGTVEVLDVPPTVDDVSSELVETNDLPMIPEDQSLATVTPVADIFIDSAKAKTEAEPKPAWSEKDHASLLDEPIEEPSFDTSSVDTPPAKGESADALLALVKQQLPLPISKDIEGRFDSLLLSRIRDIRSEVDFIQYAKAPKDQGGLGFDEDQVRLILAVLVAAQRISTKSSSPPALEPTAIAPVPSVRKPTPINVTPSHITVGSRKTSSSFPLPQEEYTFRPVSKEGNKKSMIQDVVPPQMDRRTMGPVDEIQYFSLVDFRRLAPKVENAREILKGKFLALQEESYVLFLDARDAWLKSPLYQMYEDIVITALQQKQPISNIISQKQTLTSDEWNALIEINHFLG